MPDDGPPQEQDGDPPAVAMSRTVCPDCRVPLSAGRRVVDTGLMRRVIVDLGCDGCGYHYSVPLTKRPDTGRLLRPHPDRGTDRPPGHERFRSGSRD